MNYKYRERSFPFSRFFIKLIGVILFIFLLVWIVTKPTNHKKASIEKVNFKIIMDKVKEKSLQYYDFEKVNSISTSKEKISLKKLYYKKEQDKELKKCSQDKSYIELTKDQDRYNLKIHLSCNQKTKTKNIRLYHNNSCKTYLCESKENKDDSEEKQESENLETNHSIETNINIETQKKNQRKRKINTGTIEIIDTTNQNYIYQYGKLDGIQYSTWSDWINAGETSCNAQSVSCNSSSICLKEQKIEKNQNNTNLQKYSKNKISVQETETKSIKVCPNKNYILFNNTLYQTYLDYSNINNWKYEGRFLYQNPPKDTITTKYIYVSINYQDCSNTCNGREKYYFDKYTFSNLSLANNLSCQNYIEKNIKIYSYVSGSIINYRKETKNSKCYKMIRTRKIVDNQDLTWSSYNNQTLLNGGYYYTGRKDFIQ